MDENPPQASKYDFVIRARSAGGGDARPELVEDDVSAFGK